jgi:Leucine-rich repeat (LRR) protein
LPKLRRLNLARNQLTALPEDFGRLRLLELHLDRNPLERLPDSLNDMESLMTLGLNELDLPSIPDFVFRPRASPGF